MPPAKTNAMMAPCRPPSMSPIQISRAVSTANRIVVRSVFIHSPPLVVSYGLKERSQGRPPRIQTEFAYALYKNQGPSYQKERVPQTSYQGVKYAFWSRFPPDRNRR